MATQTTSRDRSIKGPKRRNERNILTFYEKIAVIRYYDETNISRNSLAKMFHCCATQIRRILDRKQELLQQLATLSEADASIIIEEMTRKRRKFEMSAISFILHQWVERCRQLRLRTNITNQTLKETALKMAAILNLPTFRPSYRWLNRFRGKYKYNDENLAATGANTLSGELAVEDIIIEFKDALPSFMQKEISAITASAKMDEKIEVSYPGEANKVQSPAPMTAVSSSNGSNDNSIDYVLSDDDDDVDADEVDTIKDAANKTHIIEEQVKPPASANNLVKDTPPPITPTETTVAAVPELKMNAGTTALLGSVFPHLAVIHQFALLNADVKALELISQLGVHMQVQAAEGAYKQLTLASSHDLDGSHAQGNVGAESGGSGLPIYVDIDDIVLIE